MIEFIRRALRNAPAMNTLMIGVVCLGLFSVFRMRREVFPEFALEMILVTVPYPGASPEEVEEGICQKLEEAVRSLEGIKKQTAVAKEGMGSLVLELETRVDVQKLVSDVRSEVDRIASFPLLSEDPEVKQVTLRQPAITVGVMAAERRQAGDSAQQTDKQSPAAKRGQDPLSENLSDDGWQLRETAEMVREELLRLPHVSQANIVGARDYEIAVEISESTLRRYGLTLGQVAQIIRRENLELPGGAIRTEAQELLVRGKNKGVVGADIAKIPLITDPDGVALTVADLGVVVDRFADVTSFTRINGRPGLSISVERTSTEDLIAMTDAVRQYVAEASLPSGYELVVWGDRSVEVRDRLELLSRNGLQGLALVLLLLALFLNLRLACWVSLGIPVSILGACAILYVTGNTLNMLTTFTFVMALGIVVDDAIVVGENVFTHRQRGKAAFQAALDGTVEVLPSVIASIATTVIAFAPLLFVSGIMGKFIAVMPIAMISTLLVSLFEASLTLPCHLAHDPSPESLTVRMRRLALRMPTPYRWVLGWPLYGLTWGGAVLCYPLGRLVALFNWLNGPVNRGVDWVSERVFVPVVRSSLGNPAIVLSSGIALLLLAGGLVAGGTVPFIIFPKIDSNTIQAFVAYPDGTPPAITDEATLRVEQAIRAVNERHAAQGEAILELTRRSVGHASMQQGAGQETALLGHHLGSVTAELTDASRRTVVSDRLVAEWRAEAGAFPGATSVVFGAPQNGPGGTPIEFKLLADKRDMAQLEGAVEQVKARLAEYPGVFDIDDDSTPGKWEFQLRIKPQAVAMGIPLADLAETVRASYYGEEAMRLQRGRHEVKLMVRYPTNERRSLAGFDQIRVRTGDGAERPLTELAEVTVARGYSEINRVDQLRSITVSADVEETQANAFDLVRDLQRDFMPGLLAKHPGVLVRWEGQQEQTTESVRSMLINLAIALIAMYALLTWEFTSYFQPMLIMAIIPFGVVGAVAGHALMGLPLTMFSLFGLVTLTGVVVNDSIVLIDFINHRVRDGMPVVEALIDACRRRLRPIFLTSVTTIAGLLPLLSEESFQAQILIPMAVSICFGLATSTVLCLILAPTFYLLQARMAGVVTDQDCRAGQASRQGGVGGASSLAEAYR